MGNCPPHPHTKKSNAKLDSNDKTGSTKEGNVGGTTRTADNNDVLRAIALHCSEVIRVKSEIYNKIEAKISEVTTVLRGVIAMAKLTQMDAQNQTLKELTWLEALRTCCRS